MARNFSALRRRSAAGVPRSFRPNSTFSTTLLCGSRAKCWNTIDMRVRRNSRSRWGDAAVMSSPSSRMRPAVGSISRLTQRASVDLPEPERPMIM